MRCPICGQETSGRSSPRPFCSERCKLLDLYNWLSERYQISSAREGERKAQETSVNKKGAKVNRD
jgi:endogenous inhibitor of DNA gyrase (YacG/DUF329 family)